MFGNSQQLIYTLPQVRRYTHLSKKYPGIPQESPVSSVPFLLFLRLLFISLDRKYPDMLCACDMHLVRMLVTGQSEAFNSRKVKGRIATYVNWGAMNALIFDNQKTELTYFHVRWETQQMKAAKVTMPDDKFIASQTVLILRVVWFDPKMKHKHHVKTEATSAQRASTTIARLSSTEKG